MAIEFQPDVNPLTKLRISIQKCQQVVNWFDRLTQSATEYLSPTRVNVRASVRLCISTIVSFSQNVYYIIGDAISH